MLHPAQKIASFFVAKKLIPAQDYEWAVYGLQRRLLAAVFYPILFLIGGAIVFYRVDSIILQIIYITVIVILSYCIQPRTIRQELQMKIKALFN